LKTISTGVESLDEFLLGGFRIGRPSLIYGPKNVGKSLLSLQLSIRCAHFLKKPVLYIDTEAMWLPDAYNLWYSYFKKRWNLPAKLDIDFKFIPSLFKLGRYFGIEYQVLATEKRQEIMAKFPRRGKKEGVKTSIQTEDWLERSPIWDDLKKKDYGLIILDSITRPLKSVISKSTQNLPARGSALDPLLSAFLDISNEKEIAVIVTNHFVISPMSRNPYGIPWGGADIEYFIKHIIGIIPSLKASRIKYGSFSGAGADVQVSNVDPRLVIRHRFPGLLYDMLVVCIQKNYGFTDVPDYRSGKG